MEANEALGFKADQRDYGIGAQILAELGLHEDPAAHEQPAEVRGARRLRPRDRGAACPSRSRPPTRAAATCKTKKEKLGHILRERRDAQVVIQEFLETVPLFRELDDDELAQVLMVGPAASATRRARSSSPRARRAASSTSSTRAGCGSARSCPAWGRRPWPSCGPGDFFGEVEFFDGAPASAHAIAHSDCEILSDPPRRDPSA